MKVVDGFLGLLGVDPWLRAARHARPEAVSELIAGQEARILGVVEADQPLLISPFTQTRCVLWRVRLEEKHRVDDDRGILETSSRDRVRWQEEINEGAFARFWVRDSSGGRALVGTGPQGTCQIAFEPPNVSEHPHVNDENELLCRYLREHGVVPTNYMGIAGETRFFETYVLPGEAISVYGRVEEVSEVQAIGYRDAPVKFFRLVGSTEHPLVILPA